MAGDMESISRQPSDRFPLVGNRCPRRLLLPSSAFECTDDQSPHWFKSGMPLTRSYRIIASATLER